MTTIASNYHIEINPGDAGIYDRYVVQEIIKEMAQSNTVAATAGTAGEEPSVSAAASHAVFNSAVSAGAGGGRTKRMWKVLILSEVDRLTKEAQAALRRTMEKYTATCRLILIASSPSKVIEPVRSRCLGIRFAAPNTPEIMAVLQQIAGKEQFQLPGKISAKIAAQCGRNLRRAILMLQTVKVASPTLGDSTVVPVSDWERYISQLTQDIIREQSPRQLLVCRNKIFELLVNCIPADVIMKRLSTVLVMEVAGLPDPARHEITHWAAHYEHRLQLGSKELFHIEAFIAKVMTVLKTASYAITAAAAAATTTGTSSSTA
jgi:replication factor C subunit 3/5